MNSRIGVVVLCAGALLLSGCAKLYKPKPLSMPQVVGQEKNGLLVQAAPLSSLDCKYVFNKRDPHAKGYEVIQLAVTNKADHAYALDAKNIGLPLESARHVAHCVRLNMAGVIAAWGLGGLLYLGFVSLLSQPDWAFAGALFCIYPIGAIIDGSVVHRANKDVALDFEARAISNDSTVVIEPQKIMNRVMFVEKKNYKSTFDIGLVDQVTGEVVTFDVRLA
jgi:hypothetical protein